MPHPLTVVLCESALEPVPELLLRHPSVSAHARRRGRASGTILLDRSRHHRAMRWLEESDKRGRPDIVHITLLVALDSPLNRRGLLRTYVHTRQDLVIEVNPLTRLPRNYDRFVGLIEQLFDLGRVPPKGQALLSLRRRSLRELVEEVSPSQVFALSTRGEEAELPRLCREAAAKPTVFLVGGFPHGHFTPETEGLADGVFKVYREGYEAETIVCRLIHQYEIKVGITF